MTDVPPLSVALLVAVLGLFVGSFLNVVIYRVPRERVRGAAPLALPRLPDPARPGTTTSRW